MTRPFLPFVAFLVLLLLTITFSFGFAASVVPGWHITIYPLYFIWMLPLIIVLLFVVIGYWLVQKRVDQANWILFIIHLVVTIPTAIYIIFPSILLDVHESNTDELIRRVSFRVKLIPWAQGIFAIGQILFPIYFIRAIKRTPLNT